MPEIGSNLMCRQLLSVPLVSQKSNWCGYASLAMVLQYWGYAFSQEDLFEHIYGACPLNERYSDKVQIGIGNLALGAMELTSLRVKLFSTEIYEKIRAKNPQITPFIILEAYLSLGVPCIVRFPGHYNVAIGFDKDENSYFFNEPGGGRIVQKDKSTFDGMWRVRSEYLRYDSRYLLLAIYPEKREENNASN